MWSARSSTFYQESGHIPQQGLARIEAGRKRQGLVPDFLVREPSTEGGEDGLLVLSSRRESFILLPNEESIPAGFLVPGVRPLMMYTKW